MNEIEVKKHKDFDGTISYLLIFKNGIINDITEEELKILKEKLDIIFDGPIV